MRTVCPRVPACLFINNIYVLTLNTDISAADSAADAARNVVDAGVRRDRRRPLIGAVRDCSGLQVQSHLSEFDHFESLVSHSLHRPMLWRPF